MSDDYAAFLEQKTRVAGATGRDVMTVHPDLYEWQRDVVDWACERGRAAVFADCGLGKTRIQLLWASAMAERTLILAPLSVARQTVREAETIDTPCRYLREDDGEPGTVITNYEMFDHFDPARFGAVVLDESSILKNVDGATRRTLTDRMASVPYRLACTATPAPNDVAEIVNHAAYLGVGSRVEVLSAYFIHDDEGWRLKGHAQEPLYRWVANWAVALRKPSDLGYPDDGYDLPPLRIHPEIVEAKITANGQLFATDLGGVGGRAAVRRQTIAHRVARAGELAGDGEQWIIWCGLNEEARLVSKVIDGAVNVEGSMTPDAKADALEAFQDGRIRVLVTKPTIAGFGMNFQQCSRMAFLGLSDSYESYYQAIRRCYRFGQQHPVDAHVIVSSLEQAIAENVAAKEQHASALTAGLVRHTTIHREAPCLTTT